MKQIDELFYCEIESRALDFESDSGYRSVLAQFSWDYDHLYGQTSHRDCERVWSGAMELSDRSALLSFRHGLRLGLRLALWAGEG